MLGLQPPLVATRSLGASAAPLLGPPLSGPLAHAGAVSPPVAAVGFWLSGGVAVYVKYGPHAQELDPTLKLTLFVGCGIGLLSTCVLLGLAYAKDRDLQRTLNQSTTAAGGMAGLVCVCLTRILLGDAYMTVLIPESLGFMMTLVPEDYPYQMLSGFVISSCRLGMMVGVLMAYPVTQGRWNQRRLKNIVTGCSAVFVVTLVVLAFACYDSRRDPQPPANPHVIRLTAILSCQFIAGAAQGLVVACTRLMLNRVTPPKSQVTMAIIAFVLVCAGTGLGPMLSNGIRQGMVLASRPSDLGSTSPGAVNSVSLAVLAFLSALWLAAFALVTPGTNDGVPIPLGSVRGPSSQPQLGEAVLPVETDAEAAQKEALQKKLFVTYLTVQTERAWLVSGLEVVTAMVMEEEFEISNREIGLAVGSCFIIATPLMVLGAFAKKVADPPTLLISLAVAVAVLCLLIFHFPADALRLRDTASLAFLLAADTLIYPAAMTLGGMLQGLALGYAIIPRSRVYSSSVAVIGGQMLVSDLSRFLSMPISRLLVANGGRDTYAAVQFVMACLSLLSCIRIAPVVRTLVQQDAISRASSAGDLQAAQTK